VLAPRVLRGLLKREGLIIGMARGGSADATKTARDTQHGISLHEMRLPMWSGIDWIMGLHVGPCDI
jgi:hypothetical protein